MAQPYVFFRISVKVFFKGSVGMQLGQFDKRFNSSARSMFASKAARKQLKYQMLIVALALPGGVIAAPHSGDSHASVADQVIQAQQDALGKNTAGKGYGPQSPRDIDALFGRNLVSFGTAPKSSEISSVPTFSH